MTSNFSFSQCFQKACFPGVSIGVTVWEWGKMLSAVCFNLDQSKILLSGNGLIGLLSVIYGGEEQQQQQQKNTHTSKY